MERNNEGVALTACFSPRRSNINLVFRLAGNLASPVMLEVVEIFIIARKVRLTKVNEAE